eukprot:TRINITY_DN4341_c0_g2_i2.p1 TRINITY_DN4341_c0_g2~~TRINITY_DN4341_c0_g2_i2.p1  ORF type:complete len:1326 (-),score=235.46 TRINITY_DN4341_c0_g2_i2:438-3836(-)
MESTTSPTVVPETHVMGTEVAWQPSGAIFVVPFYVKDSSVETQPPLRPFIGCFERNGLLYEQFSLRSVSQSVKTLKWNSGSDILLIHINDEQSGKSSTEHVQFWHRSNGHWHLKQDSTVGIEENERIIGVLWDPEQNYVLRTMTEEGRYSHSSYVWEYTTSPGNYEGNTSITAVVDQHQVRLTPLADAVVPPPMAAVTVALPAQPNHIALFHTNKAAESWNFAALLSDYSLCFVQAETDPSNHDSSYNTPSLMAVIPAQAKFQLQELRQPIWINKNQLLALRSNAQAHYVVLLTLKWSSSNAVEITDMTQVETASLLRMVAAFPLEVTTETDIWAEDIKGNLFNVSLEPLQLRPAQLSDGSSALPNPCQFLYAVSSKNEMACRAVGYDTRGRLYLDRTLVSSECTSACVRPCNNYSPEKQPCLGMVLFTTISHKLCCASLGGRLPALPLETVNTAASTTAAATTANPAPPKAEAPFVVVRSVENGAKIVCSPPHRSSMVLQMPRGNLEAIYPIYLVLEAAQRLCAQAKYSTAFLFMRRHRIDFNLLYDQNPSHFIAGLTQLVQSLNSVDYLNLLITSLSETDCTETTYPSLTPSDIQKKEEKVKEAEFGGKTNRICISLREALTNHPAHQANLKFLLPVLTTYTKTVPASTEEALNLVKQLREKESQENEWIEVGSETVKPKSGTVSAESALKYICWLVDVNKLYDIALGMYDFELVKMVAQHSQKDPKEYRAYLEELMALPEPVQKYRIDYQLARFSKALRNLARAGDDHFDECLKLIRDKDLYADALLVYAGQDAHLSVVVSAYADHLSNRGKLQEAGLMMVNCGRWTEAIDMWTRSGAWELALSTASSHLKMGDPQLLQISTKIAEELQATGKFVEAAEVWGDYCNHLENQVRALVLAPRYIQATRISRKHGREDIIEAVVLPAVEEQRNTFLDNVVSWMADWKKLSARLKVVRWNKILLPQALQAQSGDNASQSDVASLLSGTSLVSESSTISNASRTSGVSTSSGYSGYSSLSNRGRKQKKIKTRRKRVTSKEGGQHEEEYLIETLKGIIPTSQAQEDISELIKTLTFFGQFKEAAEVQEHFADFLKLLPDTLPMLIPVATTLEDISQRESTQMLAKVEWSLRLWHK